MQFWSHIIYWLKTVWTTSSKVCHVPLCSDLRVSFLLGDATLQTMVVAFGVPSKLTITEQLRGVVKSTAIRPTKINHYCRE
jgi:hypothetical protein